MVSAGESTSGAAETRVPQVFPGSLYGGRCADGPRVKPELVGLASELRRAGFVVDVLDLEVECGNPDDDASRETFLARSHELLAAALRGAARAPRRQAHR